MILNSITYWRSTLNQGKGISQAHLARKIGVGRSFVTKLEKGISQPSAELMFRISRYFKQPVEAIFRLVEEAGTKAANIGNEPIPSSQSKPFNSIPARSSCISEAAPSARPAEWEAVTDKSLVSPTAKVVASPVAQSSQTKRK